MEKIEREFRDSENADFDDVLDGSFFSSKDDTSDMEEDESLSEVREINYRPISEL